MFRPAVVKSLYCIIQQIAAHVNLFSLHFPKVCAAARSFLFSQGVCRKRAAFLHSALSPAAGLPQKDYTFAVFGDISPLLQTGGGRHAELFCRGEPAAENGGKFFEIVVRPLFLPECTVGAHDPPSVGAAHFQPHKGRFGKRIGAFHDQCTAPAHCQKASLVQTRGKEELFADAEIFAVVAPLRFLFLPVGNDDTGIFFQFACRDDPFPRKRVRCGDVDIGGALVEDIVFALVGESAPLVAQQKIRLPVQDRAVQFLVRALEHAYHHFGIGFRKRRNGTRQFLPVVTGKVADVQEQLAVRADPDRFPAQLCRFRENSAAAAGEILARGGKAAPPALPLDQPDAQLRFERGDLLGNCRLGNKAPIRSLGETAAVGDRYKSIGKPSLFYLYSIGQYSFDACCMGHKL